MSAIIRGRAAWHWFFVALADDLGVPPLLMGSMAFVDLVELRRKRGS